MFESLHWPLEVLSRAIHYKNLTGASQHVGLSQPQLSRYIRQLESELELTLLDRDVKRKSAWTPAALELAATYQQWQRRLQADVERMKEQSVPRILHVGTLEGLASLGLPLIKKLLDQTKAEHVYFDVYDQNDLEEKFLNQDLDLILAARVPGGHKFKFVHTLGYQRRDEIVKGEGYEVFSPFEFLQKKQKVPAKKGSTPKVFISNSLHVRHLWLEQFGGHGLLPSEVYSTPRKDHTPVLLLGHPMLSPNVWQVLVE